MPRKKVNTEQTEVVKKEESAVDAAEAVEVENAAGNMEAGDAGDEKIVTEAMNKEASAADNESAEREMAENVAAESATASKAAESAGMEKMAEEQAEMDAAVVDVLKSSTDDDTDASLETAAEMLTESVQGQTGSRSGPSRRTLMLNRNVGSSISNDATRWHFYETAAYQHDYMRRPVFFGILVAARRIRAGDQYVWTAEVQHTSERTGINGVISIPYMELLVNSDKMSSTEVESRINAMLGAAVEFIVTDVIRENDMILGSRIKAMEILQRRYYFSSDRDQRPQVHLGRLVQARIMMVTPYTLTLDVFGAECRINKQEVKWEWTTSLAEDYSVGDVITVKVENVNIADGKVTVSVTGKTAENPDVQNLKYAPINSLQLGEVTSFANGIYFIRLFVGVNAVSHIVLGDKGCGVGDKIKMRVTAYNRAQGTVTGKIVAVF